MPKNLIKNENLPQFEGHKVVTRIMELSLANPEGLQTAFGKQGVKNYKRITIKKADEEIQTHTHTFLTSQGSIIPKKMKITYYLEKAEQYTQHLYGRVKCQKYEHHK